MRKNLSFIPKIGGGRDYKDIEASDVNVLFLYDGERQYAHPVRLFWRGQEYRLGPVQFWHTTNQHGINVHHYTIGDSLNRYVFQLAIETDNLTWKLESYAETETGPSPRPVLRSGLIGSFA